VDVAIDELLERVGNGSFWLTYLSLAAEPVSRVGVHLAIFSRAFLPLVFSGRKTIEARFSRNRRPPFGKIREGDIILIKEVSGPICGLALAKRAWFYDLAVEPLDRIRARYGHTICADEVFWNSRRKAAYATLIELAEPAPIEPLWCKKRDRRSWVLLRSSQMAMNF
jgi:hypothetical protein